MITFLDISTNCGDYVLGAVLNSVKKIIGIIQFVTPILLIISLTILFVRMAASPDDKKSNKRLLNAILAFLIVFLVPTMVELVLGILPQDIPGFDLGACWSNAGSVTYNVKNDYVGTGEDKTSFKLDLTSLMNAQVSTQGTTSEFSIQGLTTDCGTGKNLAGVTKQCIQGNDTRAKLVNLALSYVGYPYVWGAKGEILTTEFYNQKKQQYPGKLFMSEDRANKFLDKGFQAFDCSGFISYLYQQVGFSNVKGTSEQLSNMGYRVGYSELMPGDILWRQGHVAMYVGQDSNGNRWLIHASGAERGVRVDTINQSAYEKYRRIRGL